MCTAGGRASFVAGDGGAAESIQVQLVSGNFYQGFHVRNPEDIVQVSRFDVNGEANSFTSVQKRPFDQRKNRCIPADPEPERKHRDRRLNSASPRLCVKEPAPSPDRTRAEQSYFLLRSARRLAAQPSFTACRARPTASASAGTGSVITDPAPI